MKLRDFVTEESIRQNLKGREHLAVWDTELSEEDRSQLSDEAYLAHLEREHVELQAWNTSRYGNSNYRPDELARRAKVPEHHVWAFLAIRGRKDQGLY